MKRADWLRIKTGCQIRDRNDNAGNIGRQRKNMIGQRRANLRKSQAPFTCMLGRQLLAVRSAVPGKIRKVSDEMSKAHLLRQEQQKREQCMKDRLASYHNMQMLLYFRRCPA